MWQLKWDTHQGNIIPKTIIMFKTRKPIGCTCILINQHVHQSVQPNPTHTQCFRWCVRYSFLSLWRHYRTRQKKLVKPDLISIFRFRMPLAMTVLCVKDHLSNIVLRPFYVIQPWDQHFSVAVSYLRDISVSLINLVAACFRDCGQKLENPEKTHACWRWLNIENRKEKRPGPPELRIKPRMTCFPIQILNLGITSKTKWYNIFIFVRNQKWSGKWWRSNDLL